MWENHPSRATVGRDFGKFDFYLGVKMGLHELAAGPGDGEFCLPFGWRDASRHCSPPLQACPPSPGS